MSARGTIMLVTQREVRQRIRGKAFLLSTLALIALVLTMGIIQRVATGDDGPREVTIGVVGDTTESLERRLVATGTPVELDVTTVAHDDADSALAALDDDDLDAVFDADAAEITFAGEEDTLLYATLQQAWSTEQMHDAMTSAGLSDSDIAGILASDPLAADITESDDDEAIGLVVGMVTSILLFISLQTFGSHILMGVVEEKSTAVVEVLLARVPATQLLAGKVAGIGLVALAQFVLALAAGAVSLQIATIDVPGAVWASLPTAILWFLGGFALYAMLFGVAGSLVSRQEDAQSAVMPFSSMLLLAYLAVFLLIGSPESAVARIVSVLPPFAPLLMPMRMASGAASILEIVVAVVALALAVIGVARLAGAIYSQVVLHRGTRLRWRAVLSSLRSDDSVG